MTQYERLQSNLARALLLTKGSAAPHLVLGAAFIAEHLMRGAAFHSRVTTLCHAGVSFPACCTTDRPEILP